MITHTFNYFHQIRTVCTPAEILFEMIFFLFYFQRRSGVRKFWKYFSGVLRILVN
jgi:hypothetical protein